MVIVGSLDFHNPNVDPVGRSLAPYYLRSDAEPARRIATFDHMRQHYVAFSRAERLLVLDGRRSGAPAFWRHLGSGPPLERNCAQGDIAALARQRFEPRAKVPGAGGRADDWGGVMLRLMGRGRTCGARRRPEGAAPMAGPEPRCRAAGSGPHYLGAASFRDAAGPGRRPLDGGHRSRPGAPVPADPGPGPRDAAEHEKRVSATAMPTCGKGRAGPSIPHHKEVKIIMRHETAGNATVRGTAPDR